MMLNNHIPLDFGISIKFLLDLRNKLPVATRLDLRSTQAPGLGLLEPEQPGDGDTPVDGDTPQLDMQGDETDGQVPFSVEPSREPSPKTPQPPRLPQAAQLDPVTASYYEPATAEEFRAHRRRLERQETMSFGHIRERMFQSPTATSSSAMPAPPRPPDTHGAGSYSEPPKEEDHDFRSQSLTILAMDFQPLTSMIWSTLLFPWMACGRWLHRSQ